MPEVRPNISTWAALTRTSAGVHLFSVKLEIEIYETL